MKQHTYNTEYPRFLFSLFPSLSPGVLSAYVRACTNTALSPYVVYLQFVVFIH